MTNEAWEKTPWWSSNWRLSGNDDFLCYYNQYKALCHGDFRWIHLLHWKRMGQSLNSSNSCILYEGRKKSSRACSIPRSATAPLSLLLFFIYIPKNLFPHQTFYSAWIQTFFLGKWTIMIAPIWWTAFGKAGRCLTCRQNFHGGRRNVQRAKGMHHSLVP